eukprot:scaffold3267_cov142-Amphora_coffeaeformis.AAC.9
MGGTGAASTTAISTTAISAVATGEAIEVPEKWVAAVLRGRTNVVDKGGSSGQEGEGRGRVVGVRSMAVWPSSTASTSAG